MLCYFCTGGVMLAGQITAWKERGAAIEQLRTATRTSITPGAMYAALQSAWASLVGSEPQRVHVSF